jgi:hypothetical protein
MPALALATGRTTLAGQVEGDGPDKRQNPGPPGWGLSDWPATSPCEKLKGCEDLTKNAGWVLSKTKQAC